MILLVIIPDINQILLRKPCIIWFFFGDYDQYSSKYRGNRRMPIDQTEWWDRLGCWAAPRLSTYALSISKDPIKRCGYDDFGTLFDLFWPCNFFKAALRSWFAAFCWGWCPFFEFCTAKFRYLTASCHAATPKGTHWVPIQTPWFVPVKDSVVLGKLFNFNHWPKMPTATQVNDTCWTPKVHQRSSKYNKHRDGAPVAQGLVTSLNEPSAIWQSWIIKIVNLWQYRDLKWFTYITIMYP